MHRGTLRSARRSAGTIVVVVFMAACTREAVVAPRDSSGTHAGDIEQVLIGAGDIGSCGSSNDEATAGLLDSLLVEHPDALVFTAGDNVYEDGTAQEYAECYEPSWGRFKDRTWATIGNHEYNLGNADPTFDYFGSRVGPRGLGYYSLDVGNWHLAMLNSNNSYVPTAAGSAQEQWLRADLAANTKACVMAVFHQPRFFSCDAESGCTFQSPVVKPFWDALYEYGADFVIAGHRHRYERFAPQDPEGNRDPVSGIRQIIVGTGGASVGVSDLLAPNTEASNSEGSTFGVIKITLGNDFYKWEFVPVPGVAFTDSGSGMCVRQ